MARADGDSPAIAPEALSPAVIERVADRFKLLGDPTRLRLVNELHQHDELTVGELVNRVGTTYGAVSKQLALLRSHGVVARRRAGTHLHYRIVDPSISELCDVICRRLREDWERWGADLERQLAAPDEH